MKELAKESPAAAHSWLIDTLISILEEYVPQREVRGSKKTRKENLEDSGRKKRSIFCCQTSSTHTGQGRPGEEPQA